MAEYRTKSAARQNLLRVKSYSISQTEILGSGAFGIVYKGSDSKENTIAAKRIDGDKHPRILTQDLDKFLALDHPNVMKILDVENNDKVVWMMMSFCEHGDLNHYYKTRDVSNEVNIEVMRQIMAGISYLHSQDIVHRDIKPGNILVASENPLQLLLADFDVSKCLDPEVETSLMTSNVGTLAFKAPEFFQRISPGKIEYHRNVDIYAAGLTFLAILQAEKGKKMLIPQIETPMDDSEFHVPSIGLLISERIKYKVKELNIFTLNDLATNLKWIIREMTCVNPEERLSAVKILDILSRQSVNNGQIQKRILIKRNTFSFTGTMDVIANNLLLVRVKVGARYLIRVMHIPSSHLIGEIPSTCNHITTVKKHPLRPDCVLEGCSECKEIRSYNIYTEERSNVLKGSAIVRMFDGPRGSLLVTDAECTLFKLDWKEDQSHLPEEAKVIYRRNVPLGMLKKQYLRFCYLECHDILLFTLKNPVSNEDYEIIAVKLENDDMVWRLSGLLEGQMIKPESITCDNEGNAYVADLSCNRILKINGLTGEVLGILFLDEEEENEKIISIRWSNIKPNFTVRTRKQICTYYVQKQRSIQPIYVNISVNNN